MIPASGSLPFEPTGPVGNGTSSNIGEQVQEDTLTAGHLFSGRTREHRIELWGPESPL